MCRQTLNNMYHRWAPEMESEALKVSHWRKSSQWAVLRRDHAQIIADDTVVADAFTKHCYMEWRDNVWRDCYSDEHYLGTLLASRVRGVPFGPDTRRRCLIGLSSPCGGRSFSMSESPGFNWPSVTTLSSHAKWTRGGV